ncbi:hypothetical protein GE21DRAFT_8527 [Neurospora crassa]|uniref:Uncharacterized protein n=2 Tax=Neurospora crassa TaxID=5141 RepID=Q1K5X5_NEUCR|nr:hypothetical protein NCU07161 [Neurospora crassa OR74A]EAA28150.1 hypothetical protein NCU07161 [Neurospora crassa OR74A]KHE85815.1 hypothetical protein GE21DRAFT_8527 [Neurospora crassa]CAD71123.1 hypothetical protein [Neurospora crassa]|eukprot:XP_957386.1 hypothetical protein NCU07161 [Neurospora crassa OR74A]
MCAQTMSEPGPSIIASFPFPTRDERFYQHRNHVGPAPDAPNDHDIEKGGATTKSAMLPAALDIALSRNAIRIFRIKGRIHVYGRSQESLGATSSTWPVCSGALTSSDTKHQTGFTPVVNGQRNVRAYSFGDILTSALASKNDSVINIE